MSGEVISCGMASDDNGMDCVTFVATRRNGRALCLKGFFYHINKSVDERSYWKCRTKGCKATVVTINDIMSSSSGHHLHEPNDSRVAATDAVNTTPKITHRMSPKICVNQKQVMSSCLPQNGVKKQRVAEMSNICVNPRNQWIQESKTKTNANIGHNYVDYHKNIDSNHEFIDNGDEEVMDSFGDHLNVELEVDESGKVRLEDTEDREESNGLSSSGPDGHKAIQMVPNVDIKPNSIHFANNYTNIDHFDIEMSNLLEVVRQSGFNSLDIEQISSDWELWKKRYLELKRSRNRVKQSNSDREGENLRLKLEIAVNAKQNTERELKRVQNCLKESQNNVSALRALLKRNVLNASNNHCIALLHEINDLKRKVSAQVSAHQSNLNEVKRLLCLDDDDLRAEFDQLAQERDDALEDNFQLKQQIIVLKDKLSSFENKSD